MPAPVRVDFYYSATSPFAYLAATQMLPLQIETGCRVDWHCVWGRGLITAAGYDYDKAKPHSGQYRADYQATDMARWAKFHAVPYSDHRAVVVPDARRLALAGVAAWRFDAGQVFARALMKAVFVDNESPADEALAVRIANDVAGIEPHLFRPMLDDPETAVLLQANIERAVADGCFGVPSFVVHGRDGAKHMVYGNDRLPLLKQVIREVQAAG